MAVEAGVATAEQADHSTSSAPANVRVAQGWWRGDHPSYVVAKRLLDLVVALLALVLASPILLLAAVAIRLESPGPALFRQERVGKNGTRFSLYKLRGMYSDAERRFAELYRYEYTPEQLATTNYHDPRDPRVTRVGKWLRRTSIDELPNLWNVVKGEMSLVGPRPDIPQMLPYYGDSLAEFLSVLPGITSMSKATGRDSWTFNETLELDLDYVRTRSLALDLKILALTVLAVITRRGAS